MRNSKFMRNIFVALITLCCIVWAQSAHATITFTNYGTVADTNSGGASSFVLTPSGSLAADKCYLLAVQNSKGTSVDLVSSITGNGTWTSIQTASIGDDTRLTLFRSIGTSSSNALTISFGGAVPTGFSARLIEVDGADESTSCANIVVQSPTNFANNATPTVTMSAFADATNNAALLTVAHKTNQTYTPEAGWTEIGTEVQYTNPLITLGSSYIIGQDTSATATMSGGGGYVAIALEIKDGGAGSPGGGTIKGRIIGGGIF